MARPESPLRGIRITATDVKRRKAYLNITKEDEVRLGRIHRLLQKHADEIIDRFYEYLLSQGRTRAILSDPKVLERLKKIQRRYFERLTQGRYDKAYFEDRLGAGLAHDRIGLSPEWYLGAYNRYLTIVSDVLVRELGDTRRFSDAMVSLTRIVYLDMGLAMDAYIHAGQLRLKERTRQLEELDSKKRLLADTIVHDLRNPLAGIQGFLHMLKEDRRLSDSQQGALLEAERACAMLEGMVDNVLGISRMEDKQLPVMKERIDLKELADQTARVLEPFANLRSKEVRVDHPASAVEVRTDVELAQRILHNLVMNSIRHATGANYVRIKVLGGRSPALEVSDDGPGIPKKYQARVFDRFGAASLKKAGLKMDTGLGLVFCQMAAKELGAKLTMESREGRGTRIRIAF